jgi:hypothetical protein
MAHSHTFTTRRFASADAAMADAIHKAQYLLEHWSQAGFSSAEAAREGPFRVTGGVYDQTYTVGQLAAMEVPTKDSIMEDALNRIITILRESKSRDHCKAVAINIAIDTLTKTQEMK